MHFGCDISAGRLLKSTFWPDFLARSVGCSEIEIKVVYLFICKEPERPPARVALHCERQTGVNEKAKRNMYMCMCMWKDVAGEGDCTKTREESRRELEIGLRRI